MPTVSDLIHSSFRLIGAIAAGETLETNELADAFISLNQMIAGWNTEGTSLFSRQHWYIPISPLLGNQYSLPGRPIRIEAASVSIAGINSPLQIVDSVGWEAIEEKQAQSMYVKKLYCDYTYPASTVYIAPLPRIGAALEMWIYMPLAQFATVDDTIDLPPGYEIALRYNFAVALLPEYPRSQVDATLPAQAQMYKASLVQLNAANHLRSQMPSQVQAAAADAALETAAR